MWLPIESVPKDGTDETWAAVSGWEGLYEVSTLGRIRALARTVRRDDGSVQNFKPRMMTQIKAKSGYLVVRLRDKSRAQMVRIHRLVACAFIPNPDNKPEVNHIDSNRANPTVENLEWATRSENHTHGVRAGNVKAPIRRGAASHAAKLTEKIVQDSRLAHMAGVAIRRLARDHGVDRGTMRDAIRGTTWAHIPPDPARQDGGAE